ncbi:MAG: hypothetical protein K9J77_09900 [Rhodoferax sp.]|nr:hypothetical protein [Rhodoferax sp.]
MSSKASYPGINFGIPRLGHDSSTTDCVDPSRLMPESSSIVLNRLKAQVKQRGKQA